MSYRTAMHIWTVILDLVGYLKKRRHLVGRYTWDQDTGRSWEEVMGVDVIIFVYTHKFSKQNRRGQLKTPNIELCPRPL